MQMNKPGTGIKRFGIETCLVTQNREWRNYRLYKIWTAPLSERSSIENYYSKIIAGVLKNEKHLPKPEHIPANFIVLFNLLNRYHQYCLLYHQDKGKLRKS